MPPERRDGAVSLSLLPPPPGARNARGGFVTVLRTFSPAGRMNNSVSSTPPDTEWIEVGKAAGTGIGGMLVGAVAQILRSRKSANRRIKHIEEQVSMIQADRAAKYGEFQTHRADMTDAVAGLRDSLERVDSKVDAAIEKQTTIGENVAYIRGLLERNGKHG